MEEAVRKVDRTRKAYDQWRSSDKGFAAQADRAINSKRLSPDKWREEKAGDFAHFRKKYLGMETFPHQLDWIDLIEGRKPRWLHPSMIYEQGDKRYVLINTPPHHSKSISLTVDYSVYRICKDPNIRIKIISKTETMSKQFLYAIQQRLTHPRYRLLIETFAPPEGFDGKGSTWQANMVYLSSASRDSAEKDPTLEALGMGGHIYGARCDIAIMDDCIVLSNAIQFEKQIRYTQQEVLTRLEDSGILLIVGTRVESIDFYSEIRNPDRYPEEKSPWTYLAQPAVLEFADDPKDWVTLWPKSDQPWLGSDDEKDEDGLYPRWDGTRLYRRRGVLDSRTWSMVYQQQQLPEDSVFPLQVVRECINGRRNTGPMSKEHADHRKDGMDGLYVICSMDPAMTQDTASIVYAVDPKTQMRYILDANRMPSPTPQQIRNLIMAWTEKYSPHCWVIEKNAFQTFLTRDEEIRAYLANRGVSMVEHYTSTNKLDPDFGVASIAPLFTEKMIELASSHKSEGMKAVVEQLITWRPGVKGKDLKQDFPMCIWFAELRARLIIEQNIMKSQSHNTSKYMPRYRRKRQNVVFLDELMEEAG